MSSSGLTSGADFLRDAAKSYFAKTYQNPQITLNGVVDSELKWQPSIHFKVHFYLTVIGEVSETPYPMVFNLRRLDLENLNQPISVYCVCPEEAYLANQADAKKLISHGYGLLTVDSDGTVQKRAGCIPIIQQIREKTFRDEIKPLPKAIRQRLAESYDKYQHNAPSGVADITEVLEGLVMKAKNEGVKKGWLTRADTADLSRSLRAMALSAQFGSANASIGSVQGYVSEYRNVSHHFPKNKKQAAAKYNECRHAFMDGIKRVKQFREAMKKLGLSGAF